jgi:predicted TIM-barrel fold metal-dependent hydrolase
MEAISLKQVIGDARVVDCDTHYTEPPDLWVSRAPASYKDKVPHVRTVNGQSLWFVEGDKPWGNMGTTVVDAEGVKVRGRLTLASFEEITEAAYKVKPRLEVMDRMGVWAQIVYPNAGGFGATRFLVIEDPELRNLCVSIYNEAVAELQAESGGRLFPQAILPLWDRDALVRELQRVQDLRFTGVTITDNPEAFGLPQYTDPYWQPMWEFLNDTGLVVNFHIGSGIKDFVLEHYAWGSLGPQLKLTAYATIAYMSNAKVIINLILSGLLDRYENLKIVSVESGCGWIPFVMEALEYQVDEMAPDEGRKLKMRPRDYFLRHIYATFWFEDMGVKQFIDALGPGNLLFETDFPHPTCLYPESQEHLARVLSRLEPGVRRRVVQDNAAEIYHLFERMAA